MKGYITRKDTVDSVRDKGRPAAHYFKDFLVVREVDLIITFFEGKVYATTGANNETWKKKEDIVRKIRKVPDDLIESARQFVRVQMELNGMDSVLRKLLKPRK